MVSTPIREIGMYLIKLDKKEKKKRCGDRPLDDRKRKTKNKKKKEGGRICRICFEFYVYPVTSISLSKTTVPCISTVTAYFVRIASGWL